MPKFDKKYYDDIWGHIGGVHRHDYTESLANRLITQYGKVRILDAGTGCGHLVKLLREKGADAWGFDVSDYALENCCAPGFVVKAHASKLPFADNSFDVVHSNGLFGYDMEVEPIWKELNRVGKIQDHNIDTSECDIQPEFQIINLKPRKWWDEQLKPIFNEQYYKDIWGNYTDEDGNITSGLHRHDYCVGLADKLIKKFGKVRILDIGTACGFLVKTLRTKGCDAYGLEISDYAIENSRAKGYVIKGDVRDLPFKDKSFDLVISQGLWEYIPEDEVDKAFSECKRVGKFQWHYLDPAEQENYPQHKKITIKPASWWDEHLRLTAPTLIEAHDQINKEYSGEELDKNTTHSYLPIYQDRFGLREKFTLLEIGVSTQSLLLWKRAFPQARIIGFDNNEKPQVPDGVEFYPIDATDKDAIQKALGDTKLDIVIDDASHIIEEQLIALHLLFPRLNKDGIYFIEDIQDIEKNKDKFNYGIIHDLKKNGRLDDVLIEIPYLPKVLVSCPTYDGKDYCFQQWVDNVKSLTYPNYDILAVDNSKTEDFYNKYKDQIPMIHMTFKPDEKDDHMYRVCKSMAEVQRHFLKGDYTHWMNIEADVIPDKDVIEKLMKYGQDADWIAHVYPASPTKTWMAGIGCSLLSRKLMTDFDWDDTTIADDSPDSELWGWVQSHGGYKTVELYYVLDVKHLK